MSANLPAEGAGHDAIQNQHARRNWRPVIYSALALTVLAAAAWLTRRMPVKTPPAVSLEGLEPAIVQVLQQCRRDVLRSPRSGAAWGKLGVALLAYEFKTEARTCLHEAERFDPRNPRWPYFHGLSMFPDETNQGLALLNRSADLCGDEDSWVRNRLATILADLGEYDQAELHFKRVLKRWPDDPAAILGMGKITSARGQPQASIAYLTRAAENPSTAKSALRMLVIVQQRLGNSDAAKQILQRLAQQPDDMPLPDPFVEEASMVRTGLRAWLDDATLLYRQGQIAEAEPIALQIVKSYPESAEAWILLGRIQMRRQEFAAARQSWQMAIERAPDAIEAHVQLGVTHMRMGQPAAAIDRFRRAVELKPNLSQGFHNLGLCYAATGQVELATKAFRDAISLRPGSVDSYLALVDMLIRTGNRDEARQQLDQVAKLAPTDPRIPDLRAKLGL
jgi:tetratricopeptide (TPR) repeat protein